MAQPAHSTRFRFTARKEDQGLRLDQVLAANVPGLSRRQARVLLDLGGVFVDGARVKVAGRTMRAGQEIIAHLGGALRRATKDVGEAARARDEASLPPHRIVFQDDDLVIVDKPAGLVTAPTPESDRNNLAEILRRALGGEIFVVHRLDLDTSGLLVFARTPAANRDLSERMRVHAVDRQYLTVLRGAPPTEARTIDVPVGGRRAVTHLSIVERLPVGATLARCRLETGRTHQIRIHMQHLGHPVLGDTRYGVPSPFDPPRLALHATCLGFPHPRTGDPLAFESPLPADLAGWLDGLRAARVPRVPRVPTDVNPD
ncbi:RluA family pseudouridine synthase [Chondromyces apiculatus]|uniref:Pseudouridine synthase n=1 Tax=Chondromyces apiculatus DSM 436 TaxID=1192034 RepID=A0A017TGJ2_9BACT|nr:RluA family pseudouridine synthase [Chondromyces apiculatus]EYF07935.1 Ribosomal large subunit pseudouridine synthase D [Chondromyces apiculatus DSM 436]